MVRRSHENTLKYLKTGPRWSSFRNVKPTNSTCRHKAERIANILKKLQNSIIWEKRKNSEASVERRVMPEGARPLGTIRRRRGDNIKMDVDWIPLTQSR